MSAPQSDPRKSALEYLWGQYKVWDETSEAHRKSQARSRPLMLLLGIAGGVLGALSTPGALPFVPAFEHWAKPPAAFGIVGGILLGLAAFFTRELLSPERERRWVRARSVAEAFKREAFLVAAQAPPHDGPVGPGSLDRAQDILATMGDMQEEGLAEGKRLEGMPPCPLFVDGYVEQRLDDQIDYYRGKAGKHARVVRRITVITLVLGAVAVVLGYLVSTEGVNAGVWLSVITAVTTSLTAYLYSRRLQYLVISYLAAARNLEALRARWGTSGKTDSDTAERNQFILDCENLLSAESTSWMSEWFKKDAHAAGAGTQGGPGGGGATGGGGGGTGGGGVGAGRG